MTWMIEILLALGAILFGMFALLYWRDRNAVDTEWIGKIEDIDVDLDRDSVEDIRVKFQRVKRS